MTAVTAEALAAMDAQAEHRAGELADAQVDVIAYACLVAVMVQGPGAHRSAEQRLSDAAGVPVVSSAGALVDAVHALAVERVAMATPYAPSLTATVIDYLAAEDIEVVDAVSLGVTDKRRRRPAGPGGSGGHRRPPGPVPRSGGRGLRVRTNAVPARHREYPRRDRASHHVCGHRHRTVPAAGAGFLAAGPGSTRRRCCPVDVTAFRLRRRQGHHRPRCTTSSKGRRFSRSMTANGLSDG